MQTGASVAFVGMSQRFHAGSECGIITGHWVILARGSVEIDDHACPSFAEPKAGDSVIQSTSLRFGREQFFSRSSLRI